MSRAWPEVLWDEDFESWFYSGGASEYPRAQRASAKAEGFELVVARVIRDGRSHVATYEVAAVRVAGSIEPAPGPNEPPPQGVVVITAHDDWLLAWRRPEADTVNQAGADAMPPIDELVAEMQRRDVQPL